MIVRSALRRFAVRAVIMLLAPSGLWICHADGLQTLEAAFVAGKPILNVRVRYEDVDQVPLAVDAVALTLRARAGFETASAWGTSLLAEGNFLVPLIDDYRADNAVPADTKYPVVPDARSHYLNRLQLTNTSLPGTQITVDHSGRLQRICADADWHCEGHAQVLGAVGVRLVEMCHDRRR